MREKFQHVLAPIRIIVGAGYIPPLRKADRHDREIFCGVRSFGHFSGASQKSASNAPAVLKKGHIMICPYNINIGACQPADRLV
jgi:hypothetical protein